MQAPPITIEEGWHADPWGRYELRYWDGSTWTAHVSNAGVPGMDLPVWPAKGSRWPLWIAPFVLAAFIGSAVLLGVVLSAQDVPGNSDTERSCESVGARRDYLILSIATRTAPDEAAARDEMRYAEELLTQKGCPFNP